MDRKKFYIIIFITVCIISPLYLKSVYNNIYGLSLGDRTEGRMPKAFGLNFQYIYALPNMDMDHYVDEGHGGRLQLRSIFGPKENYFTRFGLSYDFELSFLRYTPERGGTRYNVYGLGWSAYVDISIFSIGGGLECQFIDVKINDILFSRILFAPGVFFEGGVNIPLFTKYVFLTAHARYGWYLPYRDRVAGAGDREIYFTMNNLRLYGGIEIRLF